MRDVRVGRTDYWGLALEHLRLAFDPRQALFSYSSRLDDRGGVVNHFRRPESLRYTINTYLGLSEAERHDGPIDWLGPVGDRVREFLARHEPELSSPADFGLLLVLLAATDPSHPAWLRGLRRIAKAVGGTERLTLNMQDLAWMLWGAASRPSDRAARAVADRLFEFIRVLYVSPSGLPRHSLARYRSNIVSFGSVAYYLRALYEYAAVSGSAPAREMLSAGLERVLALQAQDGAWPWMIDIRSGLPFDRYPVFTVHQDSMAMLFLFSAQDEGVPGVDEAIERSLRWNLGANELGVEMVRSEPCPWIYRSIERDERWPRARRYLRGLGPPPRAHPPRTERVRINPECRSYHLGWVLYAWSDPARRAQLGSIAR